MKSALTGRAAACARAARKVDKRQPRAMQITIEDLSPVEKRVEFELPWADVAPKLDKAYDALRKGVRLPGFRPGKVPRALLERMYRRQVEDEVARDLVEHSLGQAIRENQLQPVAPPTVDELEIKAGAPFKFKARVEVRSQVTPKDYAGVPLVAPGPQGDRRRGRPRRSRTTAAGSPSTSRSRGGPRPPTAISCWSSCRARVGEHKLKRRQVAIDLENDAEGPLPGLPSRLRGKPIGGEPIEVDYTLPRREGRARHRARRPRRPPARHHQGGAREAGPGARRRAGQGHRRGRDARGAARQGARAARRGRPAAHQARDDARRWSRS